ncbi:hypothetical protein [Paenibacillus sp.]|uniref:hypothetical protein n=1 Tax=Paenibacillus sp. TaxID=58172 RepID=UPI0028127847|nr:hypothetical protein [Paenibacillus sp.]
MVAAITEDTINFQFEQLFKKSILPDHLKLKAGDTGIEIDAKLNAPTVSFSVPGTNRAILFMLNMPSGKFTYWDGFGSSAKQKTIDFTNWVYAFTVNLDLVAIAYDDVKKGSAVPQEVQDHLQQFNDSMFTISHLFTDFEDADLASFDPGLTKMPLPDGSMITPGQITQFQQALQTYFTTLQGTDNPYILGYCVDTNTIAPSTPPTFTPTGSTFSIYSDPSIEGISTLNFLVMTNQTPLPTDPNAGIFSSNWVTNSESDGKFIISSDLFWISWLLPLIQNSLGITNAPTPITGGWSYSSNSQQQYTLKDDVKCISSLTMVDAHITMTDNRTASVSYSNDTPTKVKVNLSGNLTMTYRNDFTCVFSEWMSETAKIDWTGKITISAGDDGQVALDLDLDVPDATKSTDGNWLGKGDIALIPDNKQLLNDIGGSYESSMKNTLNQFKNLLGPLHNRFILPAGDVFFYANAQLDPFNNLTMDITYKSQS